MGTSALSDSTPSWNLTSRQPCPDSKLPLSLKVEGSVGSLRHPGLGFYHKGFVEQTLQQLYEMGPL